MRKKVLCHSGTWPQGKFCWNLCDGGRICPLGGDRVKVSENLGATTVIQVAPVYTSLQDTGNIALKTETGYPCMFSRLCRQVWDCSVVKT